MRKDKYLDMLTSDEYNILKAYIDNTPELADIMEKLSFYSPSELSTDSHNIKNYIAFLKTSFQLLKKKHPELSCDSGMDRIESVLNELISHMDRTTLYRYSMKKYESTPININDILYEIPDYIDEKLDNNCEYSFDLENLPMININPEQLILLLTEAVTNACEASDCTGEISISSRIEKRYILISITNHTRNNTPKQYDYNQLAQPFYTTKSGHTGVGLSIIHQICLAYNGFAQLYGKASSTVLEIHLPINY